MAREVERLNEEIIDLQRHNKMLLSENQKLRKEIESEGELKESYFQVSYYQLLPVTISCSSSRRATCRRLSARVGRRRRL
jgi:hypothetical protein